MTLKYDDKIRELVNSKLGKLLFVRCLSLGNDFVPENVASADYTPPWRCDRKLSGNNCMHLGILYEAMMRWVGTAKTVNITI